MATKQTTQLCYQVNGGTCRNKVSASNNYVCAAGHRAVKGMGRDEIATQLSVEAIRKMGRDAQRAFIVNPSIDRDIQQALFDTGNEWVRRNLARNPSIDREMIQALFSTGDDRIRRDLARNPSIDRDIQQALFDTGGTWVKLNLARNPSIDRDIAQVLFDIGDRDIKCDLARNPSIDREMMQALFSTGDDRIRRDLARNPSIDREMAITLAKDGHAPTGYLENKSITELCNGENISLINEHPKEFGQAYLDHLLGSDEDLDQMKTLLCYSYDCYRKADGYNPEHYKGLILNKYPGDEEIKYLLSGD